MEKRLIITYNSITVLPKKVDRVVNERCLDNLMQKKPDGERRYNGVINQRAKTKIKRCLNNFYQVIKDAKKDSKVDACSKDAGFYFLTLTLPSEQVHSDNEIKRECLNALLIGLSRRYGCANWAWVAEKQKNGNIHFHACIDRKIGFCILDSRKNKVCNGLFSLESCYDWLRENGCNVEYKVVDKRSKNVVMISKSCHAAKKMVEGNKDWRLSRDLQVGEYRIINEVELMWNEIIERIGYITRHKNNGGSDFPSTTKIEYPKKASGVAQYVTKYMTKTVDKDENGVTVEGRLWGMSNSMKGFEKIEATVYEQEAKEIMNEVYRHVTFEYETHWFVYWAVDLRKVSSLWVDCSKFWKAKFILSYSSG